MTFSHIDVSYGELTVFSDFALELADGQITCLMGPSGCGKTTLLNCIAAAGGGQRVGYVFQEPRLLPWLTVEKNICAALPAAWSRAKKKEAAARALESVGLTDFARYYPAMLSGGMRQRTSLARAFAVPCDILLMDEPFNGQDIKTKNELQKLFLRLWAEAPKTVLAVTHDVEEAWRIGHRVVVLSALPAHIALDQNLTVPLERRIEVADGSEAAALRAAVAGALGIS